MTVTVSVILPTYNRAASLIPACKSVLDQSFRDLELIIVDDASTDDIEAVAQSLGDERVHYIRRATNGGASASRNTGLLAARGRFIAFQDSDDMWLPGKLQRQLAMFDELPADVGVVTGPKILYGLDAAYNYGPGKVSCAPAPGQLIRLDEDQVKRCLNGNRISLQNTLFRRDCYPAAEWFDPCAKANADWEFTARLAQHTRIYEDQEPVVLAFISDDSISKNERKKILGLLRIMKKNRQVMARYKDIHAMKEISLGRKLLRIGKRRSGMAFIRSGLCRHPAAAYSVMQRLRNRLLRRFRTPRAIKN